MLFLVVFGRSSEIVSISFHLVPHPHLFFPLPIFPLSPVVNEWVFTSGNWMRIPIAVQLALLVLLTTLVGIAVLAVSTVRHPSIPKRAPQD